MLDEVFSNFATNLRWYQQYLERNAYLGHLMGVPPSDIGMFVRKTDERFGKQKNECLRRQVSQLGLHNWVLSEKEPIKRIWILWMNNIDVMFIDVKIR